MSKFTGSSHPFFLEMELTLQEERSLKMQVEAKLLQLKKEHSMLDCDYKQAKRKLDELQAQKEKLSEEVGPKPPHYVVIFHRIKIKIRIK